GGRDLSYVTVRVIYDLHTGHLDLSVQSSTSPTVETILSASLSNMKTSRCVKTVIRVAAMDPQHGSSDTIGKTSQSELKLYAIRCEPAISWRCAAIATLTPTAR